MLALKRSEPRESVLEIEPYVPGSDITPEGATVFKLSSNETRLGPSPDAVRAYHETAEHPAVYPDGSGGALRAVIGGAYALNPALSVCGAGSDESLNLLAHAFLGPGDEAIHTVHGFLVFRTATLRAGGRPIAVPECNYTADVDAILSAVTPRTKIVFLANRNNPTGTYVPFEEIKRLPRHLAPEVLLVLHAAYAERCNKLQTGSQSSACPIALSVLSKIGDLSALPDLTNQDLEKLGVLLGDRRKMLRAIRELGDVSVAASVSSAAAATELTRRDEAERRR